MNTPSSQSLSVPIIIIAGGKSQRLQLAGYDRKWQLPFGSDTLLQHMLDLAAQVSETVLINSSDTNTESFARYKYPVINDVISQGPLSGILSALNWGKKNGYESIITLPCDTPLLSAQWLHCLYGEFKKSKKRAVISRFKDTIHPICGIWSTQLSADLTAFMQNNEKKAVYRWASQHAQPVDYTCHNTDQEFASLPFMNINTLEDYEKAVELIAKPEDNQPQ